MTIEQMKERKRELGLTVEMIAARSGVPASTVQKIFSGATRSPRKLTLDAIRAVLEDAAQSPSSANRTYTSGRDFLLKEPPLAYDTSPKRERPHTVEDYYALPDERRAELIDGVFYDMTAPSLRHQQLLLALAVLLRECVQLHQQDCAVYIAPCDVRLDADSYTMVQPDIFLVCGDHDRNAKSYDGAPDLIVEILSPSTRSKDLLLKLYKYQKAGVREYWIADPDNRKVLVYHFFKENYLPQQYDFGEIVPVGISGGQCQIDLSKLD
ncbi:MAG: Uma2 family endonuclease [Lachnospiraceae bacterium]|nr:Uma2 family endonuclease [Lachnospiraceae bacterium]